MSGWGQYNSLRPLYFIQWVMHCEATYIVVDISIYSLVGTVIHASLQLFFNKIVGLVNITLPIFDSCGPFLFEKCFLLFQVI